MRTANNIVVTSMYISLFPPFFPPMPTDIFDFIIGFEPTEEYEPTFSAFKVGWGNDEEYTNGDYEAFINGMKDNLNGTPYSDCATASNLEEGFSFTQDNMDALLQSDIAYISGHGYFGGVVPIYSSEKSDFLGMFVANNSVQNSQFHGHYTDLPEDILNNRFSFKEAENETIENSNLQWLITAACSQLNNYIEKDSNGNDRQDMIFDNKYTYEYWLDTLINNKNMKGILGYHFTSPSGNGDVNDEGIIKKFLENNDISIYDAWLKANSYWFMNIKKTNAALLLKGDYDQDTLSESLCDNNEVTFDNVYLYTFKTLGGTEEVVYTVQQQTAVSSIAEYFEIEENSMLLSEVTRDVYDVDGNYMASEVVEYIATPILGQNIISNYSLASDDVNYDSVIYRYDPVSKEVSWLR